MDRKPSKLQLLTATMALSAAGGLLCLALPASAQQTGQSTQQQQQAPGASSRQGAGMSSAAGQQSGDRVIARASQMIGKQVRNQQGQNVGEIRDLVLDFQRGQVALAVLSIDPGTWNFGANKYYAVPFSTIQAQPGLDHVVLTAPRERVEKSQSFDPNTWPDLGAGNFAEGIYGHYGSQPYWQSGASGAVTPGASGGSIQGGAGGSSSTSGATGTGMSGTGASGTSATGSGAMGTGAAAQSNQQWMHRASQIIGLNVRNPQNDNLGEIQDIAVDAKSGQIAYAVLSFGGFLGMGDKYFAVPFSALKPDATKKQFTLNVDRDRLKNAPGFDKSNWPNMANPQWGETINAHYGTQPYWRSGTGSSGTSGSGSSGSGGASGTSGSGSGPTGGNTGTSTTGGVGNP